MQKNLSPENKKIQKDNLNLEKDSFQYNKQDLDQEQRMDVNPVQLNTQNLNIVVSNANNYSGEITGVTYLEKNKEIMSDVDIQLFFGHKSKYPVCKIKSDNNGIFVIENLPSGYYILFAKSQKNLKYQSHYIKVFAGQTSYQSILLK